MNKPALGRGLGQLMDRPKTATPSTPVTGSTSAGTVTPAKTSNAPDPGTGVKILLRGHLRPPTSTAAKPAALPVEASTAKLSLETRLVLFAADILLCLLSAWIVHSAETPLTWYAWLLVFSAVICGAVLGCIAFRPDPTDEK